MGTYRVVDGTQVHHRGVLYAAGDTLTAEPADVTQEIAAGWLTEQPTPKRTRRATA